MTKTKTTTKDYLAIVSFGAGGSFARGSDRDKVIADVKRITKADWKTLFKFKKGTVVKASVIEVTGDQVTWGYDGIKVDGKPYEGTVDTVELVY